MTVQRDVLRLQKTPREVVSLLGNKRLFPLHRDGWCLTANARYRYIRLN